MLTAKVTLDVMLLPTGNNTGVLGAQAESRKNKKSTLAGWHLPADLEERSEGRA
jgi:hypothetical protein